MMYSMKHLKKLRRSSPVIIFIITFVIIYKHIPSNAPHESIDIAREAREDHGPTDPPSPVIWAVAFTNTDICLRLATIFPHWMILLSGELQVPKPELRHSRCLYFARDMVRGLPGGTTLSAENSALLYAIQSGAEAVYILPNNAETKGISPRPDLLDWRPDPTSGLVTFSNDLFNPMSHWGCNTSWASGQIERLYQICENVLPSIHTYAHQVVIPYGTDSRSQTMTPAHACDPASPSVLLGRGTVAYFTREGTFYTRDAFWAMPFVTDDPEETFILNLLTQRLLALNGRHLKVHIGQVVRSVVLEGRTIQIKEVHSFQCSSKSFIPCVREIIEKSTKAWAVAQNTAVQIQMWLAALESMSYATNWHGTRENLTCAANAVQYMPVSYNVPYSIMGWKTKAFPPVNNIASIVKMHQYTCPDSPGSSGVTINFQAPWVQWENILLIIVFNNPLYNVIPFTEALYRPFYPQILYCGPERPNVSTFAKIHSFNISFIAYDPNPAGHFAGAFNYKCLRMAVQMNYDVIGYFVIADDLVVVPDKLRKLNTDKAWFIPQKELRTADIKTLRECRIGTCDFHTHWRWWEDYQSATKLALEALESQSVNSRLMSQCLGTLESVNGGKFRINGGYSDVYYLPKRWAIEFAEIADVFLRNYVFVELAVPTIMKCLVPEQEIEPLVGKQIWDNSRDESWLYFTKRDMLYKSYLHPAKWGFISQGSEVYRQYFCNVVLFIHDRYGRINKVDTL